MSQTTTQIIKRAAIVSTAALALILTSGGGTALAAETQTVATATPITLEKLTFPGVPDTIEDAVEGGVDAVKDGANFVEDHRREITRCARGGQEGAEVGGPVGGIVGPRGEGAGIVIGAGVGCALEFR